MTRRNAPRAQPDAKPWRWAGLVAAFSSPAGSPTLQGAPTSAAVPWHPDGVPVCVTPEPPLLEDTQRPSRAAKPAEASTVRCGRVHLLPVPLTEERSSLATWTAPCALGRLVLKLAREDTALVTRGMCV